MDTKQNLKDLIIRTTDDKTAMVVRLVAGLIFLSEVIQKVIKDKSKQVSSKSADSLLITAGRKPQASFDKMYFFYFKVILINVRSEFYEYN
jgi:hypothetical protein